MPRMTTQLIWKITKKCKMWAACQDSTRICNYTYSFSVQQVFFSVVIPGQAEAMSLKDKYLELRRTVPQFSPQDFPINSIKAQENRNVPYYRQDAVTMLPRSARKLTSLNIL